MLARVLMASIVALSGIAHAQQPYPGKPIRILIPFTAGGTQRYFLGCLCTRRTGREHRPAGHRRQSSGRQYCHRLPGAACIGERRIYAVVPGNSHVLVPYLSKAPLPFDSIKDFAPVASLARTGLFLVVNPALPANNVQDFIALAKSKPGALNSAAPGGSINQLATEMFNSLAGVKLVHIPYKGSAPAVIDVIGGQAQLSFQTPRRCSGNVRAGQLKALAISGESLSGPESSDVHASRSARLRRWTLVRFARAGRNTEGYR